MAKNASKKVEKPEKVEKPSRERPMGPARAKPKNDAYTMMLFATLVAIGLGCVLMYLDFDEYGQKSPPKENPPALPKLGEEPRAVAAPGG